MKRLKPLFLLLSSLSPHLLQALTPDLELHLDHSVTFTLHAPKAHRVKVEGSFAKKPQRMHRENGEWTLRIDSLQPALYTYRFLVKGEPRLDSLNTHTMRDVDVIYNHFVIQDTLTSLYVDHAEVPHGRLEYVWYYSTLNGMSQRRMAVYLPPHYDEQPERRYPVLYLLHGSGGDETSWSECGCACQIFDNMIASHRMEPCLVVMPNGNAELDAAPGQSPWMDKQPSSFNPTSMTGMVERAFVPEVVRWTDSHYRTLADSSHRAIAGLSLGGLHTLFIAANHPGMFGYMGLFSAQATNLLDDERKQLMIRRARRNYYRLRVAWGIVFDFRPSVTLFDNELRDVDVYDNIDQKLSLMASHLPRLVYVAIGREDKLLDFNLRLTQKFNTAHLPYEFHLTDGAHSWENWRRYLIDFLPRLFEPNSKEDSSFFEKPE